MYETLNDVPDQVVNVDESENEVEIEYRGPGHPALDVYDNYKFDHVYDKDLPITEHQEWVIGTIESNQVTIIQGIVCLDIDIFLVCSCLRVKPYYLNRRHWNTNLKS